MFERAVGARCRVCIAWGGGRGREGTKGKEDFSPARRVFSSVFQTLHDPSRLTPIVRESCRGSVPGLHCVGEGEGERGGSGVKTSHLRGKFSQVSFHCFMSKQVNPHCSRELSGLCAGFALRGGGRGREGTGSFAKSVLRYLRF